VLYFKTAEERELAHKTDQLEDEHEIYDPFPTILYLAGFTGVTFSPNTSAKRELGMLASYPKSSQMLSDNARGIIEQVEARRTFAQRKKAEFLKRCEPSSPFHPPCAH